MAEAKEDRQCPVCWHGHLGYDDESCVSCGCDWVFIRDRFDDGMRDRLATALARPLDRSRLAAALNSSSACIVHGDTFIAVGCAGCVERLDSIAGGYEKQVTP